MKVERKYLNDWEKSLLVKYGVKCPNRCGVQDLLAMLPMRWESYGNWEYLDLRMTDDGWMINSPFMSVHGACTRDYISFTSGDTMLQCLLNAVLRLAKNDRYMLSKSCLAKTGLFEDDLYRVSERCDKKYK